MSSDLFPDAGNMVSLARQIACIERELRMRRQVYPRRVADARMTQRAADDEIAAMEAALATLREVDDLRSSVVAFGAPWAVQWARDHGLPDRHIDPTHYDILARAGARMTNFVRADVFTTTGQRRPAQP
ncbi:MAG: hypothetical protein K2X74_00575 [Acetobacteraceae bacterium]|nr:hypothetical protein [Acetobacteraceae bacterium]